MSPLLPILGCRLKTAERRERGELRDEAKLLRKDLRVQENKAVRDVVDGANVVVCTNVKARDWCRAPVLLPGAVRGG